MSVFAELRADVRYATTKGVHQSLDVMAIYLGYLPSKGGPFRVKRFYGRDVDTGPSTCESFASTMTVRFESLR